MIYSEDSTRVGAISEGKKMVKFEKNENGEYECPECKRAYDKYNSFYRHYKTKHANSEGNNEIVKSVDKATKTIKNNINEISKTVTQLTAPEEITDSDSNNDIDDDDTSTVASKKTKRIHLKPVEPPVKELDENENEEETETESWIIPGLIKWGNKHKAIEKDTEHKYYLIRGII